MGWGGGEVALKWTNQKNSGDVAGRLRGGELRLKEVNLVIGLCAMPQYVLL
jgi:hypothetical protein